MPKSFAAIAELAVQGGISVSKFLDFKLPQLEIDNGVKIKNDEYLILWKRNKKVYYKPEVLQEVAEIISNSLSSSKVKYVIFSKKNYARYVNSEDNVVEEITSYHGLGYYNDRDLHDIADDTPREEKINNYIYEQNYGIDKDYNDRDIDI